MHSKLQYAVVHPSTKVICHLYTSSSLAMSSYARLGQDQILSPDPYLDSLGFYSLSLLQMDQQNHQDPLSLHQLLQHSVVLSKILHFDYPPFWLAILALF